MHDRTCRHLCVAGGADIELFDFSQVESRVMHVVLDIWRVSAKYYKRSVSECRKMMHINT